LCYRVVAGTVRAAARRLAAVSGSAFWPPWAAARTAGQTGPG